MEAAESQMEASSALQEAADALAEEEEVGLLDSQQFSNAFKFVGANVVGINLEIGCEAGFGEC